MIPVDFTTQIVPPLPAMDLLGGTEFALAGCKMSSNTAKENSGTFSDLTRKNEKLESTIDFLMKKQIENDSADIRGKAENTVKVEHRIERVKKKADKIEKFLQESTQTVRQFCL